MSSPDPVTRLNAALQGRYAIKRELGEGGMATVYLADDLKHERKVALPFWSPDGNTLYYARVEVGGVALKAARMELNPVPVVLSTSSLFTVASAILPTAGSALHPDGDRFIFAQAVGTSGAEDGVC